jgi:hypothetical protein
VTTFRVLLMGVCCLELLAGCITVNVESPWEPVPLALATMTAAAPTRTPTIPPLPTPSPTFSGFPKDYAGTFTYGFEVIAFKPCNSDEVWWLNGDGDALLDLRTRYEVLTHKMEPVHVQLRGLISDRGVYGHMGGYQREFYVQDVIDVRVLQADDCR